jgi:hypothetical protein
MNTHTTPTDEDLARERIEMASHDHPFCQACGQPMTIEVHGSSLWIECASLRPLRGIRLGLASRLHERIELGSRWLPLLAKQAPARTFQSS